MPASRRRPTRFRRGVVAWLAALVFVPCLVGTIVCTGSTPMDQWINMNPEAGADFAAPVSETIPRSDGATDTVTDAGVGATDDAATSNDTGSADDTGSNDSGSTDDAASAD